MANQELPSSNPKGLETPEIKDSIKSIRAPGHPSQRWRQPIWIYDTRPIPAYKPAHPPVHPPAYQLSADEITEIEGVVSCHTKEFVEQIAPRPIHDAARAKISHELYQMREAQSEAVITKCRHYTVTDYGFNPRAVPIRQEVTSRLRNWRRKFVGVILPKMVYVAVEFVMKEEKEREAERKEKEKKEAEKMEAEKKERDGREKAADTMEDRLRKFFKERAAENEGKVEDEAEDYGPRSKWLKPGCQWLKLT